MGPRGSRARSARGAPRKNAGASAGVRIRVSRDTHVGVELPHEAAEVRVIEVRGQDLGAEVVELVHRELLAVSGPRNDVVRLRVGDDRVAAGWREDERCVRRAKEGRAQHGKTTCRRSLNCPFKNPGRRTHTFRRKGAAISTPRTPIGGYAGT